MQVIALNSRTIPNNISLHKKSDFYQRHLKSLNAINSGRLTAMDILTQDVVKHTSQLQKAKLAVKKFQQKEKETNLNIQNKMLIKKLWRQGSVIDSKNQEKFQFISGSNWGYHLRAQQQIKQQNKRIVKKIILDRLQKIDFKKKLKSQIKQYEKRRDSLRKLKLPIKIKKAKSHRNFTYNKMGSNSQSNFNPQI